MPDKPINIAVAGLGRIGWGCHAAALAKSPDFNLAAVADPEVERRIEAEETHGCVSYAKYDEMLAQASIDAVVVATPTFLHKEMAVAALQKGLHVILEKPMALNAADARCIHECSIANDRVLTVYQTNRITAIFQHLLHIVRSGRIGRVFWVQRGMFQYVRRNDWQSLQKYGGGMLCNYAAHGIDQLLQIIGYDIKRVVADLMRVASVGDADDVVKIMIESSDGVLAQLDINQASVVSPYDMVVWGTHGAIENRGGKLIVTTFDPDSLPPKSPDEHLASGGREYPWEAIELVTEEVEVDPAYGIDFHANFVHAIRTGTAPAVKSNEVVAVMDVIDGCRESSDGVEVFPPPGN